MDGCARQNPAYRSAKGKPRFWRGFPTFETKFKNPKLKRGKHEVTVTATDQAGNSSDQAKKLKIVRKR